MEELNLVEASHSLYYAPKSSRTVPNLAMGSSVPRGLYRLGIKDSHVHPINDPTLTNFPQAQHHI